MYCIQPFVFIIVSYQCTLFFAGFLLGVWSILLGKGYMILLWLCDCMYQLGRVYIHELLGVGDSPCHILKSQANCFYWCKLLLLSLFSYKTLFNCSMVSWNIFVNSKKSKIVKSCLRQCDKVAMLPILLGMSYTVYNILKHFFSGTLVAPCV